MRSASACIIAANKILILFFFVRRINTPQHFFLISSYYIILQSRTLLNFLPIAVNSKFNLGEDFFFASSVALTSLFYYETCVAEVHLFHEFIYFRNSFISSSSGLNFYWFSFRAVYIKPERISKIFLGETLYVIFSISMVFLNTRVKFLRSQ